MRKFTLALEYFTDIVIHKEYHRAKDPQNPTPWEMFEIIKNGPISMTVTSSDDHPEFKKLRLYLANNGFINMTTTSWNGDTVRKPFKLNGLLFKQNDRFRCASAMKYDMKRWMAKQAGPVTDSKPDGS